MKILIADDDVIPRLFLQTALVKAGHEVVIAHDGAEAWQLLQRAAASRLAILDWLMPGLDGVEVCRKVRQWDHAPYVYLILLTSKDQHEDIIAGLEAGADDYLIKPFDPQELEARLRAGQRILDLQAALLTSLEQLAQAHQQEVEIGAKIQQTLLLGQPPGDLAGARVAALTIPSQPVDGDFYDFFQYSAYCLDLIVGDVMGKGIPAALLGAAIKSAPLRALSRLLTASAQDTLPEPEEIVGLVHSDVTRQFISPGSLPPYATPGSIWIRAGWCWSIVGRPSRCASDVGQAPVSSCKAIICPWDSVRGSSIGRLLFHSKRETW